MQPTPLARLSLALAVVTAPAAHAMTLHFGNGPDVPTICAASPDGLGGSMVCGNAVPVPQSDGDVAGVVDITYLQPRALNPSSLLWWASDYNHLCGVLRASSSDLDMQARIDLKAVVPGQVVTLTGFDLGAWIDSTRATRVNIFAIGGGAALFSFTVDVDNGLLSLPTRF